MFEQPVNQFAPRIFLLLCRRHRIARQQHLRLDMNQHGGHVDEVCRDVHIQFSNLLHIHEILRRNLCNRDVVNVDVLLADQVQQQIEWSLVDIQHGNRKREVALFFFLSRVLRLRVGGTGHNHR